MGGRDHAQAERPGARDHHHVLELDIAAFNGMDRARQRLDEAACLGGSEPGTL